MYQWIHVIATALILTWNVDVLLKIVLLRYKSSGRTAALALVECQHNILLFYTGTCWYIQYMGVPQVFQVTSSPTWTWYLALIQLKREAKNKVDNTRDCSRKFQSCKLGSIIRTAEAPSYIISYLLLDLDWTEKGSKTAISKVCILQAWLLLIHTIAQVTSFYGEKGEERRSLKYL